MGRSDAAQSRVPGPASFMHRSGGGDVERVCAQRERRAPFRMVSVSG